LSCSDGAISPHDFEAVIERYLILGVLDDLPQVSIAGFSSQDKRPYLAIAIHTGFTYPDFAGRGIMLTSCYFVPFSQLAAGTVSYRAMYERFRDIQLPEADRSPIQTELFTEHPVPSDETMAVRVAALLLTGRRVRIAGANSVPLGERLRFIDAVTSLLPYGMRSQLSTATWVGGISHTPDTRLFFSNGSSGQDVIMVVWSQPDATPIGDPYADEYMNWLREDVPGRAVELARMTKQRGFGRADVADLLEQLRTLGSPPQPADSLQVPPGQLPGDWVSNALRTAAHRGLLVFNPPEEMRQGDADRVEVGIARSAALRQTLLEGLRGRGLPQFEAIETSSLMSVELKGGDAFKITSYSESEQAVDLNARWEFDVLPVRSGVQTLVLCVCLRVPLAEFAELGSGRKSVPVLERAIRIRVNVPYSTRRFLTSNWQWLVATAVGLGGGIAAWITLVH
jgi:hypothetical protein